MQDNQLNLLPPGGLFTSLAPVLKHGQIMIMVTDEKDKLRVNLTQKVDEGETPLSLAVVATAAELDTELAAAIGKARGDTPVLKSVTEQVTDQVSAVPPAAAGKKAARPAKPAKAKSKVKPAKKAIAKPAAKPKAAAKPAAPRAKFSKEQLITELRRLFALHGVGLNMETFVKEAEIDGTKVGRSFERSFGGWKNFVKNVAGQAPAAAKAEAPPPAKVSREVYDVEGQLLGTTDAEPTMNETLTLADRAVGTVVAIGKTRITVQPVLESAEA